MASFRSLRISALKFFRSPPQFRSESVDSIQLLLALPPRTLRLAECTTEIALKDHKWLI
jgi:hypothetical protein